MAGKADIIDKIASDADLTKKQAGEAFDSVFDTITRMLKKGDRVSVPGFGSFSVTKRAARMGRNPATGEAIKIKASKSVRFKSGTGLKGAVNKK